MFAKGFIDEGELEAISLLLARDCSIFCVCLGADIDASCDDEAIKWGDGARFWVDKGGFDAIEREKKAQKEPSRFTPSR